MASTVGRGDRDGPRHAAERLAEESPPRLAGGAGQPPSQSVAVFRIPRVGSGLCVLSLTTTPPAVRKAAAAPVSDGNWETF